MRLFPATTAPAPPGRHSPPDGAPTFVARPPSRFRLLAERFRALEWALAVLAGLIAIRIADYCNVVGVDAVDDAAKPLAVAVVLFGVAGIGLTRFLLPAALRPTELLWLIPLGACGVAIVMTLMGFAGIPYEVNLPVTMVGAVVGAVLGVRRRGLPERPASWRTVLWPAWLGFLLAMLVLIPLFRSGFATVVGQGQDAHMAAGTAEFLKHAAPKEVRPELPVDQEWPTWRSKQAIYYATAAVSTLTAMETYEVLSAMAALMFALAAVGLFLVAREMFGAGVGLAALAMAMASLDRMAVHTAMHPYYNQIWGYMTMPFGLVLAWRLVREPSIKTAALLLLVLAIEFFAYPLAGPIVTTALATFWWVERRQRLKRGEPVRKLDLKRWLRTFRAQRKRVKVPIGFVVFLLLVPMWGAFEKLTGATQLLINHRYSLEQWGGDLDSWFPEAWFFAVPNETGWPFAVAAIVGLALWQISRLPRSMAWAMVVLVVAGAFVVGTMRAREYGWYFHFKMLAFLGPLLVVLAVVALGSLRRARWLGVIALIVWTGWALDGARDEASQTYDELPKTMLALRDWAASVPADASIRLDVQPEAQNWPAYMMSSRRLCSQRPLDDTAYPHVALSRAADYVVVRRLQKPFDAVGAPLRSNTEFTMYKLRPGLPGGDRCSQRMVQTVGKIRRG